MKYVIFRLKKTAEVAQKYKIPYFTTTLSISPKKMLDKINIYWNKASALFLKTQYLHFDFRKNDWYKKSLKLTKEYDLYRQDFCGCNYSRKPKTVNREQD